jgi:hypothetical protein
MIWRKLKNDYYSDDFRWSGRDPDENTAKTQYQERNQVKRGRRV